MDSRDNYSSITVRSAATSASVFLPDYLHYSTLYTTSQRLSVYKRRWPSFLSFFLPPSQQARFPATTPHFPATNLPPPKFATHLSNNWLFRRRTYFSTWCLQLRQKKKKYYHSSPLFAITAHSRASCLYHPNSLPSTLPRRTHPRTKNFASQHNRSFSFSSEAYCPPPLTHQVKNHFSQPTN